jgi:hypothetical protein
VIYNEFASLYEIEVLRNQFHDQLMQQRHYPSCNDFVNVGTVIVIDKNVESIFSGGNLVK